MPKQRIPTPGADAIDRVYGESVRQIRKDIVIKDIAAVIRRIPLEQSELLELFEAIKGRFRSKSCARCGHLTVDGIEGEVLKNKKLEENVYHGHFICNSCSNILMEKLG